MSKLILRLGGIMFTNFIAWLVIGITSMLSVSGRALFPSLESLLAILILPLNSLLNPLIYKPALNDIEVAVLVELKLVAGQIVACIYMGWKNVKSYLVKWVPKKCCKP